MSPLRLYLSLSKPRICLLSLLMAVFGFFLAGGKEAGTLVPLLVGLGAVGAASGMLNQVLEVESDSQMLRTRGRPLPLGQLDPGTVTKVGLGLALAGTLLLLVGVNPLTAVLAAATLFLYLAVYTPSKKQSWLSTFLGAIPGALPPVIGYTGAYGTLGWGAYLIFGILFLWQIPHFFALAWIYREDYARAGIQVLPVIDPGGKRTLRQTLIATVLLIAWSLSPLLQNPSAWVYAAGALVLGLGFLGAVLRWRFHPSPRTARVAFLSSLLYLPLWGAWMVWQGR